MVAVIARTVRGLEWVAADEVAGRFGQAGPLNLAPRQVGFSLPAVDGRLTELATVDDVFVVVGEVGEVGGTRDVPERLARQLNALDWETPLAQVGAVRTLPAAGHGRFDVVASLDGRRRFNRYAVERAVGSALSGRLAGRFAERDPKAGVKGEVNLTVRLFVNGPVAVAALRLTARPLHRRAYKQDTAPGTLHPPLAATLVRLVDPRRGGVVADPFCGDGTVPIELARSYPGVRACAGDLAAERLAHARANARRAGVAVDLLRTDAGRPPFQPAALDAVVTNPPWQRTVQRSGSLALEPHRFLRELPGVLGETGVVCLIVDAELDLPQWLERLGYAVAVDQRIRIAGRISRILLCGPSAEPTLPRRLRTWHRRARAAGLITADGF